MPLKVGTSELPKPQWPYKWPTLRSIRFLKGQEWSLSWSSQLSKAGVRAPKIFFWSPAIRNWTFQVILISVQCSATTVHDITYMCTTDVVPDSEASGGKRLDAVFGK